MGDEHKRQDEPEHEQAGGSAKKTSRRPWKHPDDGTELSERDQERPLKP